MLHTEDYKYASSNDQLVNQYTQGSARQSVPSFTFTQQAQTIRIEVHKRMVLITVALKST